MMGGVSQCPSFSDETEQGLVLLCFVHVESEKWWIYPSLYIDKSVQTIKQA